MLTYDDLTEDEKNLSFLVVNSDVVYIGSYKSCNEFLNRYLPLTIDDKLYGGDVVNTVRDLNEYCDYHSGVLFAIVGFKDSDGNRFTHEIVSSAWYADDANTIEAEDIYKVLEERREE